MSQDRRPLSPYHMGYADEPSEGLTEAPRHGDTLTPVFREGSLIKYTGRGFSALSDHRCLLETSFIRIPKDALLMYVDTIIVDNRRYLTLNPCDTWTEQHGMLAKTMDLMSVPGVSSATKMSIMHRFLYDSRVVRTADGVTNLHLDYHYVKQASKEEHDQGILEKPE